MITEDFTINNKSGLHIRPASILASEIGKYESDVVIIFDDNEYNAKSVISILSACIKKGHTVTVTAKGEDEAEAMRTVGELIHAGLGESTE